MIKVFYGCINQCIYCHTVIEIMIIHVAYTIVFVYTTVKYIVYLNEQQWQRYLKWCNRYCIVFNVRHPFHAYSGIWWLEKTNYAAFKYRLAAYRWHGGRNMCYLYDMKLQIHLGSYETCTLLRLNVDSMYVENNCNTFVSCMLLGFMSEMEYLTAFYSSCYLWTYVALEKSLS